MFQRATKLLIVLKGPHERKCCVGKSRLGIYFVKKIGYGRRSWSKILLTSALQGVCYEGVCEIYYI